MTNGEKFKDVFGFGADGSRVIAVNSTWWDCDFQIRKPKTKGDLVRAMTDEELAEFIGRDPMRDICPNNCQNDRPCKACALDWLRQEVE